MRPHAPLCGRTKSLNICIPSTERRFLYKKFARGRRPPVEPNFSGTQAPRQQKSINRSVSSGSGSTYQAVRTSGAEKY
jgi:hypothetical protein